ncbi:hypothetical protein GCM10011497_37430 [Elstera cyanobacteriorum]|nr:SOS response-associated peptidase family protein [Elstera cyanobacteriorum]GGA03445.1 hypothetical protein GCM10011497_37430 [Elstera cyanobacteriorum]
MCSLYKLSANLRHLLPEAVGPIVGWHGPDTVDLPKIRPTNIAPIVVARDDGLHVFQGRWGFPPLPSSGSKTPIINARNLDSRFWRPHLGQRALIPTTGFCEWDAAKQPWWFEKEDGGVFAFAGLYTHLPDEPLPRFVIVTTAAEPPVVDEHPKAMPRVLPFNEGGLKWCKVGTGPTEAIYLHKKSADGILTQHSLF